MVDEAYGTLVVCQNGHGLTGRVEEEPERGATYCPQCGAPTLSACPACNTPIRGHHYTVIYGRYVAPRYCHHCGAPYPWTASSIQALRAMAQEASELSDSERARFAACIDDLVRDTPRTGLAVQRIKQLATKLAQGTWEPMRQIIVSVATDAAKRSLGLG
jgi:hypothetical protein